MTKTNSRSSQLTFEIGESSNISDWHRSVVGQGWVWYAKVLSANDTKATKSHQAGVYVPKWIAFELFPEVNRPDTVNPDARFPLILDSHRLPEVDARLVWYNNSENQEDGTRDECRITRMGRTPVRDPDSTGSVCVFAFKREAKKVQGCRVWLCRNRTEEETVFAWIGPVKPADPTLQDLDSGQRILPPKAERDKTCWLTEATLPKNWKFEFPPTKAIVDLSIQNLPGALKLDADGRLLSRDACASELFYSVEELLVLPRVKEGFGSIEIFADFANSVLNRRKSRYGKTLELQLKAILEERQVEHSYNRPTEGKKRPDFIFPSIESYYDKAFPVNKLTMLGVKTTLKDRWRQILNEANRIPRKHLLTLQHGISEGQWSELQDENVQLVVPRPLFKRYSKKYWKDLVSLEDFIGRLP